MPFKISIEKRIGAILLTGTLIATSIVLLGGILYLWQYGRDNMQFELLSSIPEPRSIMDIWHTALSLTPLGLVQLGLIILVGTQLLRVLMLFFFYLTIGDIWFTIFCGFVSVALIYSFFYHL